MKTSISFRLRKDLDADLIAMEVNEEELANLCRNGLRYMLGIRTAKTVQVVEQLIVSEPQHHIVSATKQIQPQRVSGQSAVYKPKGR